jgi:hypothetical protein
MTHSLFRSLNCLVDWTKSFLGEVGTARRPAKRSATVLSLETLEKREVLNGDWFTQHLPDPNIANLARQDWYNHGSINYNDMLGIYSRIEKEGYVSSNAFTSLRSLSANASVLHTPDSVRFLETQVINTNPANRYYQGHTLGYLHSGSSPQQLQLLVDKWFLGEDLPYTGGVSYSAIGGYLFGSNGAPSFADVHQGAVGDCSLLSSLAETAARDPSAIKGMFTFNGNNTLTVRFYEYGSPVYVTVDNELPDGGNYFDQPQNNVLWVALAEKAYAELNAFDPQDGVQGNLQYANSYTSLNGLDPAKVLTTLTDRAGYSAYNAYTIAQALNQGDLVVLGSSSNIQSACPHIAPDHAYAVLGYNSSTGMYTLFNPWGINGGWYNGQSIWGEFQASAWFLETYFTDLGGWTYAAPGTATGGSVSRATVMPANSETSSVASTTAPQATRADAFFLSQSTPEMGDSIWLSDAIVTAIALHHDTHPSNSI